jgi:hypothetical protein
MSRRLLLLAAVLLAVVATACDVRTSVVVEVADDGSGIVEVELHLDAEATSRLPDLDADGASGADDLAALVRVDDLLDAGWTVDGPVAEPDGATTLRATRPFGTPDEAEHVLAGLTGPAGALRDLEVTRTESFGRTTYGFSGTLDLSGGLEAFGDEGVAAALDGSPVGDDVAAIELQAGEPLADVLALDVTARLPGDETTWAPRLGDAPVEMAAESTVADWPVLGLALVAALSLAAAVVVLVVGLVAGRRG